MALDPWPLTPRPIHHEATQPNPARIAAISFFYDGCYPLHYPALQFSYALLLRRLGEPPLDPDADVKPPGLQPRSDSSSSAPGLGMTLFSTCRGLDTKGGGALLLRPLGLMR